MSCSNDIQLNTQFKKYKKKYFTEINTNDTIQCMLLNKYVKYNVLEYLEYEENEFIIQSNTNDHFYYNTPDTSNKKNKINFYNKIKKSD